MYRDLSVIMVRMRVLIFIVFVSFLLAGCTTQFRINAPLAVGYGEAYPVAGNATASERQLNRRVDILLKTKAK